MSSKIMKCQGYFDILTYSAYIDSNSLNENDDVSIECLVLPRSSRLGPRYDIDAVGRLGEKGN